MAKRNYKAEAKNAADKTIEISSHNDLVDAASSLIKNPKLFVLIAETTLDTHGWYATTIGGKKIFIEQI